MPWRERLPPARGRFLFDENLGPFTWLRVGGPAEVLFLPADVDDLAGFLAALDPGVPLTPLGVGSNVIVRDGGVEGVVVRLAGRSFSRIEVDPGRGIVQAGAGALDAAVARAAAQGGLAGLEFYSGVPGTIGGALIMNAGCYGSDTSELLIEAEGVTRSGDRLVLNAAAFGYGYRTSGAPADVIWTSARFRATPDDPEAVRGRMEAITARREATQPIREKTGGSTFKNPPGHSAWRLVHEAGWRGRGVGQAMMSPLHANFMINRGEASAADLENLGEAVRSDVRTRTGIGLEWEIRRIGRPASLPTRGESG